MGKDVEPLVRMLRIKHKMGTIGLLSIELDHSVLSLVGFPKMQFDQSACLNDKTIGANHSVHLSVIPFPNSFMGYAPMPLRICFGSSIPHYFFPLGHSKAAMIAAPPSPALQ